MRAPATLDTKNWVVPIYAVLGPDGQFWTRDVFNNEAEARRWVGSAVSEPDMLGFRIVPVRVQLTEIVTPSDRAGDSA